MTRPILTAFAAAAVLAACQSPPQETAAPVAVAAGTDPAAATMAGEDCPDMGEGGYFFWMEPLSAEAGERIVLYPYFAEMPGMFESLPGGCLGDVALSPDGLATLSRGEGGAAIVTIAEDAPAGETLFISGNYGGSHGVSGRVEIFRREDSPLVGTWKQDSDTCPADSAVKELKFSAGGDFSVTWTPFEVYKDYWGTYSYDPGTGAIGLRVEGGNQMPDDIVTEGTAEVTEGVLRFEALSFGTPSRASGPCDGAFRH